MRFPKGYFELLEKVVIEYEKIGLAAEDLGGDLYDALSTFHGYTKEDRWNYNQKRAAAYKRIVAVEGGRQLYEMEYKMQMKGIMGK